MAQNTYTKVEIPVFPRSREFKDINPDPTRYKLRPQPTFNDKTCEVLGLNESWWEPLDENEALQDRRKPLLLPRDLHGYEPLRLWFNMPHIAHCEKNDDWYEVLFTTLLELTEDLCISTFGVGRLDDGHNKVPGSSPWADPQLSPSLLFYVSEIARQDNRDGGWDELLADPLQRAMLAQGVLAKVLDEYVFSALLFGGSAQQQDALGQWDRIMLTKEGYKRKYRRCEEVQLCLGGEHIVTPQFWTEVERVTAQTAQLLLPLINLQRTRARAMPGQAPVMPSTPSLAVFYQRLHDVVALAGYASLCMAWSTSVFQVEFPQPGMAWSVDQEREADEHVYASSRAKALAASGPNAAVSEKDATRDRKDWESGFIYAARVKIVMWPRITRFTPEWDGRHTIVRRATAAIMSKSHNAYYYSGRVTDPGHGNGGDAGDAASELCALNGVALADFGGRVV
ncbi:MAG: hypothetical protein STHCBS139747_001316 [Sporothrix thermara]